MSVVIKRKTIAPIMFLYSNIGDRKEYKTLNALKW